MIFGLSLPAAAVLTIAAAWGHGRWMGRQKELAAGTPGAM
jgi:hypothetical protein